MIKFQAKMKKIIEVQQQMVAIFSTPHLLTKKRQIQYLFLNVLIDELLDLTFFTKV